MVVEEYRNLLINDIKDKFLKDINFTIDRKLRIEDLEGLSNDLLLYLEENEGFRRNVDILLRKISIKLKNDISNYIYKLHHKKDLDSWYITIIREFENYYREFAIACGDAVLTNNEIYEISIKKSVKEVIESTYDYLKDNAVRKVSIR